jgi:hypothetical protein
VGQIWRHSGRIGTLMSCSIGVRSTLGYESNSAQVFHRGDRLFLSPPNFIWHKRYRRVHCGRPTGIFRRTTSVVTWRVEVSWSIRSKTKGSQISVMYMYYMHHPHIQLLRHVLPFHLSKQPKGAWGVLFKSLVQNSID